MKTFKQKGLIFTITDSIGKTQKVVANEVGGKWRGYLYVGKNETEKAVKDLCLRYDLKDLDKKLENWH